MKNIVLQIPTTNACMSIFTVMKWFFMSVDLFTCSGTKLSLPTKKREFLWIYNYNYNYGSMDDNSLQLNNAFYGNGTMPHDVL